MREMEGRLILDNLNGIFAFVQVVETRSFVSAAKILGVSASAVGKSVARLEEQLNGRLLHRSTRSVQLTVEGTRFLEHCRSIIAEIKIAEAEILEASDSPQGKIRVSLPAVNLMFTPVLTDFLRAFPEIELEIDSTDRMVNIVEEGFDAVIRVGKAMDSSLVARTIGNIRQVVVGSPSYFKKYGIPRHPNDLKRHFGLMYKFPSSAKVLHWGVFDHLDSQENPIKTVVTSNSMESLLHMADEGLGLACLPDYGVRSKIGEGSLVPVLEDFSSPSSPIRVLWPSNRQMLPKLRVFVDFLVENMDV